MKPKKPKTNMKQDQNIETLSMKQQEEVNKKPKQSNSREGQQKKEGVNKSRAKKL